MNKQRKETIAAEILRLMAPRIEAINAVQVLQQKLYRDCSDTDTSVFAEKLIAALVPEADRLLLSNTISVDEAKEFTAEIIGEILGTSVARGGSPYGN